MLLYNATILDALYFLSLGIFAELKQMVPVYMYVWIKVFVL